MNVVEFKNKIKKVQLDQVASFIEIHGGDVIDIIMESIYSQLVSKAGARGRQPVEITSWFTSKKGVLSTGFITLKETPHLIIESIKANLVVDGFIVREYFNSLDISWSEDEIE